MNIIVNGEFGIAVSHANAGLEDDDNLDALEALGKL